MPKQTMPDLERQLEADTEAGLVENPTPNGMLTADLCMSLSPSGEPCTLPDHPTGRHSWKPEPTSKSQPPKGRASMTGIVAPQDEEFTESGDDYLTAGAVQAVAGDLIELYPELAHLTDVRLAYRWKRKGGMSKGQPTLGKCQKPSGLLAHFANVDYVVWLAADHAHTYQLTPLQLEALVFHELMHTDDDAPDDAAEPHLTTKGHDVEEFSAVIRRYGLWQPELREFAQTVKQLSLDEAP